MSRAARLVVFVPCLCLLRGVFPPEQMQVAAAPFGQVSADRDPVRALGQPFVLGFCAADAGDSQVHAVTELGIRKPGCLE